MAGFFERLANMIDEEVSKAGANGNTASVPAAAPKKPVTWNEFLEQTGKDIDQQVISHARKEGLIYVGGKCKFTATKCEEDKDKETFVVNVDAALYFKDQDGKEFSAVSAAPRGEVQRIYRRCGNAGTAGKDQDRSRRTRCGNTADHGTGGVSYGLF